ncbi:MAG: hypothetical protein AAGD14_02300 [Planctomycetota bacterium]
MPFLHVTSRLPDRANDKLLGELGGRAFPTFMVISPEGDVMARQAGALPVQAMEQMATGAQKLYTDYNSAKEKAAAGDEAAKLSLAVLEVPMGKTKLEDFLKAHPDLSKFSAEDQKRVRGLIGVQHVENAQKMLQSAGRDQQKIMALFPEIGKTLFAAHEANEVPAEGQSRLYFYYLLGQGGVIGQNRKWVEISLPTLEEAAKSNQNLGRIVDMMKQQLATMPAAEEKAEEEEIEEEVEEEKPAG